MPVTLKRLYLGTMPKGVSSPCGLVTVTTEPTLAPNSSARSLPRMMGGREAGAVEDDSDSVVAGGRSCGGVSSSDAAEPCLTVSRIALTLRSS